MVPQGRRSYRGGRTGGPQRHRAGRGSTTRNNDQRTSAAFSDGVPQIYQEMLSEVEQSSSGAGAGDESSAGGHHAKRRRVGERSTASNTVVKLDDDNDELFGSEGKGDDIMLNKPVQMVYDIDASDESGMEWEEVDLEQQSAPMGLAPTSSLGAESDQEGSFQLTLEKQDVKSKQRAVPRRKPVTAAEKKWRLDIHKVHILCLLSHVQMRNKWCNDQDVQKCLKRILSKHTTMCLNPKPELPQFTRSTTFADGLKQAADTFRRKYKVTVPGMQKPHWLHNPGEANREPSLPDDAEIVATREDFLGRATALQGSRDLGAQFFCALLRGVGVESRLVCSLQTLPFSGVAKGESPRKPENEYIVLSEADAEKSSSMNTPPKTPATNSTPVRRLGQPQFSTRRPGGPRTGTSQGRSARTSESAYPVFWIEAFNEAMQKWVTVDPIVTNTIGKPGRLEPPAADRHNNMSYVIAFEDDLSARDVTRRYVKSFNSKTRKTRVEQTKGGEKWWARTMQEFERPFLEDRDQLEFGELTSKTTTEGMPRNIQDFKDHPIYALERHLRRNEVIHPKREIGKVGLSKATPTKKNPPLESVYRRADVHIAKSADGWYRQGRSVKAGEQPVKRIPVPRNKALALPDTPDDDNDGTESQETPMYATFQTELYDPPPVVEGRVPKNVYGNIDVYAANMVPQGGFHLKHPFAAMAARILGIHYAEAVTGFQFKGRQGTAVMQGIVAAVEYQEALYAVVSALEDERAQAEKDRKTKAALQMWKQLMIKLRVVERIESYTFERDDIANNEKREGSKPPDDFDEGGGFLPEDAQPIQPRPPSRDSLPAGSDLPDLPGLSMAEENDHADDQHNAVHDLSGIFDSKERTVIAGSVSKPSLRSDTNGSGSRYNLVVIPKGEDRLHAENPTSKPLDGLTSSEQALKTSNVDTRAEPAVLCPETQDSSPAAGPSHFPVVIDSSDAKRSASMEEVTGSPEVIHERSDSLNSGSMISHDPEDEDADPDWLLSD